MFLPAVFWPAGDGRQGGRWFLVPALLVVGAVFFLAWRGREGLLERFRRRMPAAAGTVAGALGAIRTLLGRPGSWGVMAGGGLAVWTGNIMTFYLAAAALGAPVPFTVAAAAFSLGSLAGVASGTPGGVGTTEAAAIIPLVHLGVPDDLALAAVLLARGIHYLSAILLGGVCALAGR